MSVSQIKRGVYTREDSTGIESNKGTFFESIMAPIFEIEMVAPDASATVVVSVAKTFCSVSQIIAYKVVGGGGLGDELTLIRIRASVPAQICTFTVDSASPGDSLLPVAFNAAVSDLQPGDSLSLVSVKAAGSPAAEVHITVRID